MSDTSWTISVSDEAGTRKLACQLAESVEVPMTVCLIGDLGTGKTSFVRAFAEQWGVDSTSVVSPTFSLCQTYQGRYVIHHIDAYRLNSLDEFYDLGVDELFSEAAVTFVEWGDRVRSALTDVLLTVSILTTSDTGRRLTIEAQGTAAAIILGKWRTIGTPD